MIRKTLDKEYEPKLVLVTQTQPIFSRLPVYQTYSSKLQCLILIYISKESRLYYLPVYYVDVQIF